MGNATGMAPGRTVWRQPPARGRSSASRLPALPPDAADHSFRQFAHHALRWPSAELVGRSGGSIHPPRPLIASGRVPSGQALGFAPRRLRRHSPPGDDPSRTGLGAPPLGAPQGQPSRTVSSPTAPARTESRQFPLAGFHTPLSARAKAARTTCRPKTQTKRRIYDP